MHGQSQTNYELPSVGWAILSGFVETWKQVAATLVLCVAGVMQLLLVFTLTEIDPNLHFRTKMPNHGGREILTIIGTIHPNAEVCNASIKDIGYFQTKRLLVALAEEYIDKRGDEEGFSITNNRGMRRVARDTPEILGDEIDRVVDQDGYIDGLKLNIVKVKIP